MATYPKIEVIEEAVNINDSVPGMASSIAVIGAFNSTITDLTSVQSDTQAHQLFGTTETVDDFKGTDTIDYLFIGASDLLVANITTWTDAETPEPETTLTNAKLESALAKLKNQEFNILMIAEELTDEAQTMVTTWLANEFKGKFPHGQVLSFSRQNAQAYTTSVATLRNNVYYPNTQRINWYGTLLSLNQSTALMAGLIASRDINRSLTAKILDGVTGVSPLYNTEAGEIGAKLLELNIPFIDSRNPRLNKYICVNSKLPNGLDLSINRSRDYILSRLEVETQLGEQNGDLTMETLNSIVESVREEAINTLQLCKDIKYHIERVSSECVDIVIDKIIFDGIITEIKIHYSVEVQ